MKKTVKKYLVVGISLAIINFGLYTIIARVFVKDNNLLWLTSLIASCITTFIGYILHSTITWKERSPGKLGIIKFFIWNLGIALFAAPFLSWLFKMATWLYQFAFNISQAIHLPFDYDFVESTGVFVLSAIVTTTFNYLFYDKFVFGKKKSIEEPGHDESSTK